MDVFPGNFAWGMATLGVDRKDNCNYIALVNNPAHRDVCFDVLDRYVSTKMSEDGHVLCEKDASVKQQLKQLFAQYQPTIGGADDTEDEQEESDDNAENDAAA